jgi:hypothetical protein
MPTWSIVLIVVVVLVVVAAALVAARLSSSRHARRSEELQQRFGPEYDRLVAGGSRRAAERELSDRERRHAALDLKPLKEADRSRFADEWEQTQLSFLDDPAGAVRAAETLVQQAMTQRGYPSQDSLAAQASELSVEHARQLANLRSAQQISVAASAGRATTEDLRQAMVRYRALFADLLRAGADELTAYPDEPDQRVRVIPS